MKPYGKQTVSSSLKQLEPELEPALEIEQTTVGNANLPWSRRCSCQHVLNLPDQLANEAVKQLDELALIGYPALDPATRSVYATTIRLVAERALER